MGELALETERLTLRVMRPSDFDGLKKIFGDPKVVAFFDISPFNDEQMRSWLEGRLNHHAHHGYGLLSVILKSEGILIGDCGLENLELESGPEIELGYDFRSDYWNQGYATEAACAVRDFAFNTLALPSLISLIRVGNEASRRVSQKIGMQKMDEITLSGTAYWKYGMNAPAP